MEIRASKESDIPAIVELLKQSLGEDLMPKTEVFWKWKHIDNPFGVSPVLISMENNVLTGVRAFMRWTWRETSTEYHALRAVDTATHPQHQGKGIFKKLTLNLVDTCTRVGDDFVFNTPNAHSKPGYLKMGWTEAGNLPVRLKIDRPFSIAMKLVTEGSNHEQVDGGESLSYFLNHGSLEMLLQASSRSNQKITTKYSKDYLIWRYLNVPVARYVGIGDEGASGLDCLVIGRIKGTRWGRELRITDGFSMGSSNRDFILKLKDFKKNNKIDYTTISGALDDEITKLFLTGSFKISRGPIVTVRPLRLLQLNNFRNFVNWSPSLGDLELF